MPTRRVIALLVACLALSACGGEKSNGVAQKSPQQILDEAKAAIRKAGTVHVKGVSKSREGDITFDVDVNTANAEGTGTMRMKGATVHLVLKGGKVYTKAPSEFFIAQGMPKLAAALYSDRWLAAGPDQFAYVHLFFPIDELLTPTDNIEKGSETKLRGKPVVEVRDPNRFSPTSFYVRTTGEPLLEQITSTGMRDFSQEINFSEYGKKVTVEVPAGAVDLSSLRGG